MSSEFETSIAGRRDCLCGDLQLSGQEPEKAIQEEKQRHLSPVLPARAVMPDVGTRCHEPEALSN